MKFRDIPQMTQVHYRVDVSWQYLQERLDNYSKSYGLDLDPDFQRAHVWTESQQVAYIEFQLRGGVSGKDIYFNCPGFQRSHSRVIGPMVLVDGKQRLQAVLRFLQGEITAFGHRLPEYEDKMNYLLGFGVWVNDLESRNQVLRWYLDLNSGIAHTDEELNEVRRMIATT